MVVREALGGHTVGNERGDIHGRIGGALRVGGRGDERISAVKALLVVVDLVDRIRVGGGSRGQRDIRGRHRKAAVARRNVAEAIGSAYPLGPGVARLDVRIQRDRRVCVYGVAGSDRRAVRRDRSVLRAGTGGEGHGVLLARIVDLDQAAAVAEHRGGRRVADGTVDLYVADLKYVGVIVAIVIGDRDIGIRHALRVGNRGAGCGIIACRIHLVALDGKRHRLRRRARRDGHSVCGHGEGGRRYVARVNDRGITVFERCSKYHGRTVVYLCAGVHCRVGRGGGNGSNTGAGGEGERIRVAGVIKFNQTAAVAQDRGRRIHGNDAVDFRLRVGEPFIGLDKRSQRHLRIGRAGLLAAVRSDKIVPDAADLLPIVVDGIYRIGVGGRSRGQADGVIRHHKRAVDSRYVAEARGPAFPLGPGVAVFDGRAERHRRAVTYGRYAAFQRRTADARTDGGDTGTGGKGHRILVAVIVELDQTGAVAEHRGGGCRGDRAVDLDFLC